MGTSTDGQICYGVAFEEYYEFPWDGEYRGDVDRWWIYGVHGFKHSFELYNENGDYLNNQVPTVDQINRYYDEERVFAETIPLPIELVNYCSSDFPMYILAIPGVKTANRGYPEVFDPALLTVTDVKREAFLKFCADYKIELPKQPTWLLSSYCG